MKLSALLCGALLSALPILTTANAQSPSPSANPETCAPGAGGGKHHGGPGGGMAERLIQELNLTPDQQNQLKPVFEDIRSKMKAIHQDSSLSQEQKREKSKEIRQANRAKIEAVLTPEQKQKFASLRAQHGKDKQE